MNELTESKKAIEKITSSPCLYFAYTWGRHNARLRKLVAGAGYKWGIAATHGPVHPTDEAFSVPRINIDRHYSLGDFKAILRGDWDYLRFIQALRSPKT